MADADEHFANATALKEEISPKAVVSAQNTSPEAKHENGKNEGNREKRRERSRSRSVPRRRHRERSRSDSRRRRDRSRDRRSTRDRRRSPSDSGRRRRERSRDRRRDRRSPSRSRARRSHSRSRSQGRRSYSPSRSRSRSRSPVIQYARPTPSIPPLMVPTLPTGLSGGLSTLPGGLSAGLSTLPGGLNPLLSNPYLIPNLSGGTQAAGLSQATRPARRLYVGGLPTPCYDYQLQTFLNQALVALGLCRTTGKMPIIQCTVTPERSFAFIEFADMMDATCALALDGIPYMGSTLKIKRPKDYNIPYGAPPDPQPLGAAALAALLAQQGTNAMAGAAVATATGVPQGTLHAATPPSIPSQPTTGTTMPPSAGGGASWP